MRNLALIRDNTDRKTTKSIDVMLANNKLFGYSVGVVAKSTTSREKLNDLDKANSTPFNHRAFFVRNFRTPKENPFSQMVKMALHSMVGRNGQSLTGYLPCLVVSHPVTLYRQIVRNLAVAPEKLRQGLSAMIYKFLLLGTRLKISTYAQSETEARQFLNLSKTQAVCFARVKGAVYA